MAFGLKDIDSNGETINEPCDWPHIFPFCMQKQVSVTIHMEKEQHFARPCVLNNIVEYIRYKTRRVCMSLSAWSVFCLLSCHLFKHNYRMTFWNFGQKVISIFTCELNVFCRCSCWQSNSQLMFVCLTMINYVSSSARRGQELISSVSSATRKNSFCLSLDLE